jgi:integrase
LAIDTVLRYSILSDVITNAQWTKSKSACLYRYNPTGQYFARVRFGGKLHRKKLGTRDYQLARRKLADFRRDLGRTDARASNTSFGAVLDAYLRTLGKLSPSSQNDKGAIIAKLRSTWFGIDHLPLRMIKPSQVETWLSENYGGKSESYYNSALTMLRGAFDLAVRDRIIIESPAAHLSYKKRAMPVRLTPTFEEFKQIVADIRNQKFNADAEESGDFVEALGLLGLGQAELSAIRRSDVDLEAGRIIVLRRKTSVGFVLPLFPQARELIEKLCSGKRHSERLFTITDARKALRNACERLNLPPYSHRALRRMFVTRCIEKGIDVKVIAEWQGHRDGGRLILQTYSHVRRPHSDAMAQLLNDQEAANVVPMTRAKVTG